MLWNLIYTWMLVCLTLLTGNISCWSLCAATLFFYSVELWLPFFFKQILVLIGVKFDIIKFFFWKTRWIIFWGHFIVQPTFKFLSVSCPPTLQCTHPPVLLPTHSLPEHCVSALSLRPGVERDVDKDEKGVITALK